MKQNSVSYALAQSRPCSNAAHQLFCAGGGAKATAASVVSSRKVRVSCK